MILAVNVFSFGLRMRIAKRPTPRTARSSSMKTPFVHGFFCNAATGTAAGTSTVAVSATVSIGGGGGVPVFAAATGFGCGTTAAGATTRGAEIGFVLRMPFLETRA